MSFTCPATLSDLPSVITTLPALRVLDLRSNNLAALPPSIADLPALEKLDLRWNPDLPGYAWFARLEARGCVVYR